MKKCLVALFFLVSSMALAMEATGIATRERESVTLKNYKRVNNPNCVAIIKLTLSNNDPSDITMVDDDGLLSFAVFLRLIENDYPDKVVLGDLVDLILPNLLARLRQLKNIKIKVEEFINVWSSSSTSPQEKWTHLKDLVFKQRENFSYATHGITTLKKYTWERYCILTVGLVANDENNHPPEFIVSLEEPIKIPNADEDRSLRQRAVSIKKSTEIESALAKIALLLTRRYFAQNGRENITYDSAEYKLVISALESIEAAFPFFSKITRHSSFWGLSKIALVPAEKAHKLALDKNNLASLFQNYTTDYLGINTLFRNKETKIEAIKEANEVIRFTNEIHKKNDPSYIETGYLPDEGYETDEDTRAKIKEIDDKIKQTNDAWKKPTISSPLHFVYMFGWGGGGAHTGFQWFRYWVIQVRQFPLVDDSQFEVIIQKSLGKRLNYEFYKLLFSDVEIPIEEIVRIM